MMFNAARFPPSGTPAERERRSKRPQLEAAGPGGEPWDLSEQLPCSFLVYLLCCLMLCCVM